MKKRGRPIKEGTTAEVWLSGLLSGEDKAAVEVHKRATAYGISPRTLARAKKSLGVRSYNTPTLGWFWTLKTAAELAAEREIPVATDANLDQLGQACDEIIEAIRRTTDETLKLGLQAYYARIVSRYDKLRAVQGAEDFPF